MDATAIVERLNELGVKVSREGCRLRFEPVERTPDLVAEIRTHKQAIADVMGTRSTATIRPQTPLWHARTIARVVQTEGVCLFWSDALGEVVAFVKDDKQRVPAGVVSYTSAELQELFQDKPTIPPETLRMIHATKRAGGRVASREMEC